MHQEKKRKKKSKAQKDCRVVFCMKYLAWSMENGLVLWLDEATFNVLALVESECNGEKVVTPSTPAMRNTQ